MDKGLAEYKNTHYTREWLVLFPPPPGSAICLCYFDDYHEQSRNKSWNPDPFAGPVEDALRVLQDSAWSIFDKVSESTHPTRLVTIQSDSLAPLETDS